MAISPMLWVPWTVVSGTEDEVAFQLAGDTGTTYTATIPAATYYSPAELRQAIIIAMETAGAAGVPMSCDLSAAGLWQISSDPGTIRMVTSTDTMLASLGFTSLPSAWSAAAEAYTTAAVQTESLWLPEQPVLFDSFDLPEVEESLSVALGGQQQAVQHGSRTVRFVGFDLIAAAKMLTSQEAGATNEAFQRVWNAAKSRFRWWPDATTEGTYSDYFLEEPRKAWAPERMMPAPALYRASFKFGAYV